MTSYESTEDRFGKTEVTTVFFKKLGEKLRNYQRYKKPVQLSESSSVHSCSLDLHSNVKVSEEAITSDKLQSDEKDYAEQIVEMKSRGGEGKQQIEKDKRRKKREMKERSEERKKAKACSKWEDEEKKKIVKPSVHLPNPKSVKLRNHLQESQESEKEASTIITLSRSKTPERGVELADKCDEDTEIAFNLGNNNTLSILKSKNDPHAIVYDLQNSNGCRIHLERMANRAMLLTVDSTGKRLYISCDF